MDERNVIEWVADCDPELHSQFVRVLGGSETECGPIRALVETEGVVARPLSLRDADGQWAGGAFLPSGFTWSQCEEEGQPWTSTRWALTQLREFGLDPTSARARKTARLVGENSRWDNDGQPHWPGQVEGCIDGRTVADGAYFGVDVSPLVPRLIGESPPDGGWNCELGAGTANGFVDQTTEEGAT